MAQYQKQFMTPSLTGAGMFTKANYIRFANWWSRQSSESGFQWFKWLTQLKALVSVFNLEWDTASNFHMLNSIFKVVTTSVIWAHIDQGCFFQLTPLNITYVWMWGGKNKLTCVCHCSHHFPSSYLRPWINLCDVDYAKITSYSSGDKIMKNERWFAGVFRDFPHENQCITLKQINVTTFHMPWTFVLANTKSKL